MYEITVSFKAEAKTKDKALEILLLDIDEFGCKCGDGGEWDIEDRVTIIRT